MFGIGEHENERSKLSEACRVSFRVLLLLRTRLAKQTKG